MDELALRIGYTFCNPSLRQKALTHPSMGGQSFQRLEFLGDRVLSLVIAHWLYESFPEDPEGFLAKRFVELVKKETLLKVAHAIALVKYLSVDVAPASSGRVEADACEALLGAIYLDGGLVEVSAVIHRLWKENLAFTPQPPIDAKSKLQEYVQSMKKKLPGYVLVDQSGPSHSPTFHVKVEIEGEPSIEGIGKSKREAEQNAAQKALQYFEKMGT